MQASDTVVARWEQPRRLDGLPSQRVTFVRDAHSALREEWERRGSPVLFVLGTNRSRIEPVVDDLPCRVWSQAMMHVPRAAADDAVRAARSCDAQVLVAVGGGSAVGFAKWVAHALALPIVAVPTTLAGSEATSTFGVTDSGGKHVSRDPAVLPESVVYDATFVESMPRDALADSGLNALAHAVDSLWAPGTDPAVVEESLLAAEQLARGLRSLGDPTVPAELLQRGTYRASSVFSAAHSGLHHRICHVLGGTFGLPHARTHAAVLAPFAAAAATADPRLGARLATALGGAGVDQWFSDLFGVIGSPATLSDLGLDRAGADRASQLVAAHLGEPWAQRWTPQDVAGVLDDAFTGRDGSDPHERSA